MANSLPTRSVAVIGAATAGAEVAGLLSAHGILVAVFEQNTRPYGKIEDGLPRWHEGLRRKEYEKIRAKLAQPGVHFVPSTRIGRDIDFAELVEGWGFHAVVLANGAWRDRPLALEGAEAHVGRGLLYQNPFVIAFNHLEDPGYDGPRFAIRDDTLVVGGGLASIDVAKIHTLHLTQQKLAERGIEVDLAELEAKGIPKTLEAHGLAWSDLGLAGCTVFYRRRVEDMPLMSAPDDATPERLQKVYEARRRMLEKATEKFLFRVEPLCAPDALLVEDGRLAGLRFRRTRSEGGRLQATDETFERRGAAVISSIGSIPEPIAGIDMKGELFDFSDWDFGRLARYPSVFSAGNVVTGKGNIAASRKHAAYVTEAAIEAYLGIGERHADQEAPESPLRAAAGQLAQAAASHAAAARPATPQEMAALVARIESRQRSVGYRDLDSWLAAAGAPC